MLKYLYLLGSVFVFAMGTSTFACDGLGIVKNSSVKVPVGAWFANSITEEDFLATIHQFESYYGPKIENEKDMELVIFKSWASSTVNAFSDEEPGKAMITIYGGLARYAGMTTDSLMLALCHELGHHFGGYPKKTENRWSSAEGQADYYSTSKCLRRIWANEDNLKAIQNQEISPEAVKKCQSMYASPNEVALCERSSLASQAMVSVLQSLEGEPVIPKFETPDPHKVTASDLSYPAVQCRLDTYFQGSLCSVSEKKDFDDQDAKVGACYASRGDRLGIRPACWFLSRN